jgi:hypothetical protein
MFNIARSRLPGASLPEHDERDIVLDRLHVFLMVGPYRVAQRASGGAVIVKSSSSQDHRRSAQRLRQATCEELAPERISARNDLSDEHTVISVVNEDLPGCFIM